MDKTKKPPFPEKTSQVGDRQQYEEGQQQKSTSERPVFVRGTIDPPTKKKER